MPGVKPELAEEQIVTLLQQHFTNPIEQLTPIHFGEVAQTLSFRTGEQDYILRINRRLGANFEKEMFIAEHVSSPLIPIPPFVCTGRIDNLRYAVTRKVPGQPIVRLPFDEYLRLLPQLIEALDAIHHVDITGWPPRYGTIGDDGVGLYPSWRNFITNVRNEEEDWNFYGKWHALFDTTFLERDFFDQVYDQMVRLLDFCPEERFLVHGNYGFSNVIAHEGKITGVIDWIGSLYGDFVYDVAWLNYWLPEVNFFDRLQQLYQAHGHTIPHFEERRRCYECHIALDAMRFYAKANRSDSYQWTRKRITELMK
jgi:hygromycin-B 4-O-kinase